MKLYNQLSRVLMEYELTFFQSFVLSIDESLQGLNSPLFLRNESGFNGIAINFDPQINQVIREAKYLNRLVVGALPDNAHLLLQKENRLKANACEVGRLLCRYKSICRKISTTSSSPPALVQLLAPHIQSLDRVVIYPGMHTLSWTSLRIDEYIETADEHMDCVEQLVTSIYDCIENRIERNLGLVSALFGANYRSQSDRCGGRIATLSSQIEIAVTDACELITSSPSFSELGSVREAEILKLQAHYQWALFHKVSSSVAQAVANIRNVPTLGITSLEIDGVDVSFTPSLAALQEATMQSALTILESTKLVPTWSFNREHTSLTTFYDKSVQDKDILRSMLLLHGRASAVFNSESFEPLRSSVRRFSWLWLRNPGSLCLDDILTDINRIDGVANAIRNERGALLLNG